MTYLLRVVFVAAACATSACSGYHSHDLIGNPPSHPSLSWRASWVSGTQTAPIQFQSVGQTAMLAFSTTNATPKSANQVIVNGSCASASEAPANSSVIVTAVARGLCTVNVGTSSIAVSVP
jgi:hypothetical protein